MAKIKFDVKQFLMQKGERIGVPCWGKKRIGDRRIVEQREGGECRSITRCAVHRVDEHFHRGGRLGGIRLSPRRPKVSIGVWGCRVVLLPRLAIRVSRLAWPVQRLERKPAQRLRFRQRGIARERHVELRHRGLVSSAVQIRGAKCGSHARRRRRRRGTDFRREARFDASDRSIPLCQRVGHRLDRADNGWPFISVRALNGVDEIGESLNELILGLSLKRGSRAHRDEKHREKMRSSGTEMS